MQKNRIGRGRPFNVIAIALAFLALLVAGQANAQGLSRTCTEMDIPVLGPNGESQNMYGTLCKRHGEWPDTVVFQVHGTTLDSRSFDWVFKRDHYSATQNLIDAGYATLSVDRIGSGRSTLPPSNTVNTNVIVGGLHQVVDKLRSGTLCDGQSCDAPAFGSVYFHGHSQGSVYGWVMGAAFPNDFDAFVFVGTIHDTPPALFGLLGANMYPANLDPMFGYLGLDDGYVTPQPGTQELLWFDAGTHVHSGAYAENLKSVASFSAAQEAAAVFALQNPPPEIGLPPLVGCTEPGRTSPSCAISKPVFLMAGDVDTSVCGGGGPLPMPCTTAALESFEGQFYQPGALAGHVYVPPAGSNAGHLLYAHDAYDAAWAWLLAQMQAAGL